MTTAQRIVGALYVDCGEQLKNGTWIRQPRARYECVPCRIREGPVTGAAAVIAFVSTIRARHHATHHPNQQGAQAA
jgi:hypothetical protein